MARFVVVGGLNTAITYAVYLVALRIVHYRLAYTISYVAGIVFSYVLNSRLVFRRKLALASALQYPLVYLVQYVAGVTLLSVLVGLMGIDKRFAPMAVVLCTLPLSFFMSRWVLRNAPQRN